MAVNWENAEFFDERPGMRMATAAASSAALEMAGPATPPARSGHRGRREHDSRHLAASARPDLTGTTDATMEP
jgi:hypothetical protein